MGSEGAKRCTTTDEHANAVRLRSAGLQILDEGVAQFLSEGESRLSLAFPAHVQPCALPVDVTESQLDDIPGAQSESREQKEDRAIPLADDIDDITGCDNAFDFLQAEGIAAGMRAANAG